jgi:hypothetical protein
MYIKVLDAKGLQVGYDSNEFRPLEHMLLIENNQVFGAENLFRNFSQQEWQMFLSLINMMPSGVYGDYTWERC